MPHLGVKKNGCSISYRPVLFWPVPTMVLGSHPAQEAIQHILRVACVTQRVTVLSLRLQTNSLCRREFGGVHLTYSDSASQGDVNGFIVKLA